jgi:hypothetical protein
MFIYILLMGRTKTVSDADVFQTIRRSLAAGGEKSVTFASIARSTGLAGPTLVQRFGSRAGMIRAAHLASWDALDAATSAAVEGAEFSAKGAHNLLKTLSNEQAGPLDSALLSMDFRDAVLRKRAEAWRQTVEATMNLQLGGNAKARTKAAILFAAWQGQHLWQMAGGKSFKMKDAVKQLT